MSRLYTHLIPFKSGATAPFVRISLPVDFAVVCGQPGYGGALLLPAACPHEYHVAGGYDGLPYRGDLGRAGGFASCNFLSPVSGVFVATYTENLPSATITPYLVVGSVNASVGSGNNVTRANISLGGSYSVLLDGPPQPLAGFLADYPLTSIYTGPKPGYTVFYSNILPLV